jgi:hypothetical protein
MSEYSPTEEIFDNPESRETAKQYKLDWETSEIKLGKGKYSHTVKRPSYEQLLQRERALQTEIRIAKDGSITLPDDSSEISANAALYDQIKVSADGYPSDDNISAFHKSAVIKGLYQSVIEIDADSSVFDSAITIRQEIGGDEFAPEFTVLHFLRQPSESELRDFKLRTNQNQLVTGKRGQQTMRIKSTLKTSVDFYDKVFERIAGVEYHYTSDMSAALATIDALVKAQVISVVVNELTGALLD